MSTPPEEPPVPPSTPDARSAGGGYPPASPYAGSGGYPTASGYPPPDWSPQPPAGWSTPQPYAQADPAVALRKARTALGWAIGATVGAFLAMFLAFVAVVVGLGSGFTYEPLRSSVDGFTAGSDLPGDTLRGPLTDLLRDVGSTGVDISCPDTDEVDVSTAVVCTGDVDGSAWTGIVFFEDADGTFVVLEV